MILVATDDEIYGSLQPLLDAHLGENTFLLESKQIRSRFPEDRVEIFDDFLAGLQESGELYKLAKSWLTFYRVLETGERVKGRQLIQSAIDELVKPLPSHPKISQFEITYEIETGNLIHRTFSDLEELVEFINQTAYDPGKIREIITPKRGKRKISEQMELYNTEEDEEW